MFSSPEALFLGYGIKSYFPENLGRVLYMFEANFEKLLTLTIIIFILARAQFL